MRGKLEESGLLKVIGRRHLKEKVISCVKSDQVRWNVRTEYWINNMALICGIDRDGLR